MPTQITCPQCGQPISTNILQIVDVDQNPQLKQMIMQGMLNVAQCQNCGWTGQVASPMVYHESAHDLLISFVPMELNIPYAEQERMMGQMVRAVVESVPQEKRRAYLLQPQQMMRWQTFLEKILETEGITKDVIERQRKQSELLQTMATASPDVVDYLFKENKELIDDLVFVNLVQSTLQQASQQPGNDQIVIGLSNLQARLMTETEAGKQVEQRQLALHALQLEAKEKGGVTPEMLAEHVERNQDSEPVINALVSAVGGLNYEFFSAFSARIDAAAKRGDQAKVDKLTGIRTRLLKVFDEMREQSAQMINESRQVVNAIAAAPDKMKAIQQNAAAIDEVFMSVLDQEIEQARKNSDLDRTMALKEIQKLISDIMEQANPPQMQLLTMMMRAENEEQMGQVLDANEQYVNGELLETIDKVSAELPADSPPEMLERLSLARSIIAARVAT